MHRLVSLPGRGGTTFELMKKADAKFGSPHRHFRSIHVGGTNGKGSVATKIAACLQNAGYKVGLFTSPHIWDFRERIQIDMQMIPEDRAQALIDLVYDPNLSFFDCLTLMAFLYFAEERVDFALIEVGIGGRLDATNVIRPILSLITSIGFDHMALLGNTLEKIAREKGGIIKPNMPLVVGPTAAPFFPIAHTIDPHPFYEMENRALAEKALQLLGISERRGLEKTPPCRFERQGNLLFDCAHNPPAFQRLAHALKFHYPGQTFVFNLAFSKDKDWESCVEKILPVAKSIRMVKAKNPRLRKDYPGFEWIDPIEVKEGVVAGSFYVIEEIQSKDGAPFRFSHV